MNLSIFLNDQTCNLHCKYCYINQMGYESHKISLSFVPDNFIQAINNLLPEELPKDLSFTLWGGEPLTNKHLEEVVISLKKEWPSSKIQFITNGILLKEKLSFIREYIHCITVSNDMCYHKRTRGYQILEDSSYDDVIRELILTKHLTFQTVISNTSPSIYQELLYFRNYLSKLGLPYTACSLGYLLGRNYGSSTDIDFSSGEISQGFRDYYEYLIEHLEEYNNSHLFVRDLLIEGMRKELAGDCVKQCSVPRLGAVDIFGNTWNCNHEFELDESDPHCISIETATICKSCKFKNMCFSYKCFHDQLHRANPCNAISSEKNCKNLQQLVLDIIPSLSSVLDSDELLRYFTS